MSNSQIISNEQRKEDEPEELIEENISFEDKGNINEKNNKNNNQKENEISISDNNNEQNNSKSNIKNDEIITINIKPDIYKDDTDKKELINELIEKEKLLEQLITANNELKSKIDFSNKKFEEIVSKLKTQEKDKLSLESQIKKIDNEIKEYKTENDKYIKQIEILKNKKELRDIMENDSNIKILLQTEQDKNKELKNKLSNIKNINLAQKK